MKISEKKNLSSWAVSTFFFLATVYFFSKIFFGLDFTDSFYHLNQATDNSGNYNPFTFLSSLIINGIIDLFGKDLLIIRLINSIFLYLSVILPFFFIPKNSSKRSYFFSSAIVLIIFTVLNSNIPSYDTFSLFITVLVFLTALKFFNKPDSYWIIVMAMLSALSVFIRLPNFYSILIITLFLFASRFYKLKFTEFKSSKFTLMYVAVVVILIALGYFLNSSNPFEVQDALVKNHGFWYLTKNYFNDFLILLLYISCSVGFYLAISFIDSLENSFKKATGYFVLLILMGAFLIKFVLLSKYSKDFALSLTALALTVVIINLPKKGDNFSQILMMFFFFLIFTIPFGSNTGLLKSSFFIVLLPLLLMYSRKKKNMIKLLIIITPFSVIENMFSFYEDDYILSLTTKPDIELFSEIMTTESRADYLEGVNSQVQDFKEKGYSVFFYGDKSHIFSYIYPDSYLVQGTFLQPLEYKSISTAVEERLKTNEKIVIFIIDSYPESISEIRKTSFIREFQKEGFKFIIDENMRYLKFSNEG